jgi:hypothetical protein
MIKRRIFWCPGSRRIRLKAETTMLFPAGKAIRRYGMNEREEIVLYVEDIDLVEQKKIDNQDDADKEVSLIRGFFKKAVPPDMAIQMEK